MKRYLRFWMLPLVIVMTLATVMLAQAAITLISFEALVDIANHKISLLWRTGSELDFAGFYVQRSMSPESGFERLNSSIIPAAGEGGAGAIYFYDDPNVNVGMVYYYQLEMIDFNGSSSFSEVISATFENTETPTATVTLTKTSVSIPDTSTLTVKPTDTQNTPTPTVTRTPVTPTPTVTRTPVTPTPTRTKTNQPTATNTRTPTPFHAVTYTSRPRATSTPTETPTITPTQTVSPTVTTTLAPLPSLTLLFPVHSPTPTSTSSPTVTSSPVPPSPTPTPKPENHIPLRVSFLWGIIILLWLTLAGFLFVYLRRMSR
jgi:hypothetical protein